ncbi:MAG: hypothetical protein AAGJ46_13020 [Planctomycetota bacterium]
MLTSSYPATMAPQSGGFARPDRIGAAPLVAFVVVVAVLQAALVPSFLFTVRTPLRVLLYGSGLVMLCMPLGRGIRLPTTGYAYGIVALLTVGMLHPETNSTLGGLAAIMLNLAILSPVFWVSRLRLTARDLEKLFFLFWAFHAVSAALGILETVLPGTFARTSSIAERLAGASAEGLMVTLADGTRVYRPMGLTDTPGGAAASGMLAVLYGSALSLRPGQSFWRWAYRIGIVCGLFCIYICQVRSILILTVLCVIAMAVLMARRGEKKRVASLVGAFAVLGTAATVWAFSVGGSSVSDRISSLSDGSASEVYYRHRGHFLEQTATDLAPKHPLGAGLARWGMVYGYFGDKSAAAPRPIWVEIQATGWLLDGGLPLVAVYYVAILVALGFAYRVAITRRDAVGDLAIAVAAYDLAILANTFSYAPFIGQAGLDFWLVNSCLMTVVCRDDLAARRQPAEWPPA